MYKHKSTYIYICYIIVMHKITNGMPIEIDSKGLFNKKKNLNFMYLDLMKYLLLVFSSNEYQ